MPELGQWRAEEAVELLSGIDPLSDRRQVAILSVSGEVEAFTGEGCDESAGHQLGDGYSVQGNLLANEEVVPKMAKAFEESEGLLADRMMAALRAGQEAGGDLRGRPISTH